MKKLLFSALALLSLCSNAQTYPFTDDFESYASGVSLGTQNGFSSDMVVYSLHGENNTQGVAAEMNSLNTEDSIITPLIGTLTPYSAFTFYYRVVDVASYPAVATTWSAGDKIEVLGKQEGATGFTSFFTIDMTNHISSTNFKKMYFGLSNGSGVNGWLMLKVTRTSGDYFVDFDSISVTNVIPALTIKPTVSSPVCNGTSTGNIDVVVEGGVPPYTFAWSPSLPATQSQANIPAGTYSVTVTDNSGKTASKTIVVTEPEPVNVLTTVTNAACYGSNNGSIDVTVQSGVAPFSFMWSTGAQTEDLNALTAGTYVVSVMDANGCTASVMRTVLDPAAISVSETHTDVTTPGGNDGTITWTTSGGVTNYLFSFNGGNWVSASAFTGLSAGCYALRVKDNNNCLYDSAPVCLTDNVINGISDLRSEMVSVYPNPAVNSVTVKSTLNAGEISLTSSIGEVVVKQNLLSGEEKIDLTNVAQGSYVLNIKTGNGNIRRNISVVK